MRRFVSIALAAAGMAGSFVMAAPVAVRAPDLRVGATWTVLESHGASRSIAVEDWEHRTYWDLRPPAGTGRLIERVVTAASRQGVADRTLCSFEKESRRALGCRPFRSTETSFGEIEVGSRFGNAAAVAEGVVVLPSGPIEAVLVRESEDALLRYRFVSRSGLTVALLSGPRPAAGEPFRPDTEEVLAVATPLAAGPVQIPYTSLHRALTPGATGFLQYSFASSTATPTTPLSSFVSSWTSVASMISIDQNNVSYQPDPNDPSSQQVLPKVWDFTGLQTGTLSYRTFNTTRDDTGWDTCLESCSAKNQTAAPPDGTWQGYLKIDTFNPNGTVSSRDLFMLNDNDTGADPSIDVPFVVFDELNSVDREQICFDDSAGGASRLLKFLKFRGANPSVAVMSAGDPAWSTGAWTNCTNGAGLFLTTASACGNQCYPGCSALASPRARGMLDVAAGIGFRMQVVDEGYVHVPAGNFVPALLLRQDTDIQAGASLFGVCNLSPTRNRAFDYFWVSDAYGLLASVSSPTDTTGALPPDDWSSIGNVSDGGDFTWGPYPPWQITATACLSGTHVGWALPADGSNLNGNPGVADYGYVVSWGNQTDPLALSDWNTNPNHTPLPGSVGYLAAPAGGEPTSSVITGWPGASINATVVTALRYTDPSAADLRTYRSTAFYKVTANPAKLDAATFKVGEAVAPFAAKSGADVQLTWPAVTGAAGYHIRVWDLATKVEIACPAGLDCHPTAATVTHAGAAASAAGYGYRVTAIDACGGESTD